MSVASGVEFGDVCEAALAVLPEVIGNIETLIGGVTIRRAGDIAVQVAVGEPVCRGDVIETAADGRIGIRFIDGTVFNLSRDTRVVLSEFIYGSNRNDSALVAVTRGTFAFMAGGSARTDSFWVDTPVGSIRSRAYAGGMGMLSLTALVFSFIKEAQAADPDVTFLDDDSITYKDFAHGAFELITKEAIPRHIIVEDPGETIVLSKIGSSVSVSPVANSPSRMEELRIAQQDVLANFAQGWAPLGSSTPDFLSPRHLLQPINFNQPDLTHPQNSLAPLEFAVFTMPAIFIPPPPPPPPAPPTLEITGIGGQIGIAADNIINAAKASTGVQITGTTSGVEDGQVVAVIIVDSSNHVVYSGTATVTSNTWSISVIPAEAKALADGIYTLTADVSNTAGIPAEASQSFRVDETPPTIAIGTIVGNNVVNVKAASTGFAITGSTTDAEDGQPVTVKIIDSSGQVVDTFTTTLTNNSWSVSVTSTEAKLLHDGTYTVTADVSDSAGNPALQATQAITVDETPPTVTWLPPAERGIEGTTIALGTITATVNSLPGHSDSVQSLVVSGIPAGAVLTDGTNCFVATSGNTSVDVNSWNLSNLKITPPNDTNFTLTVTATDQDANSASASELITVAPLTPALHPIGAHGNENTAIALDLGVMAQSLSGTNGDALPNSLATLVVSDIPVGATLSDGTGLPGHSFTATAGSTTYDVAGWNLSSLKITPPAEFEGCFKLTIAATERDSEGDTSATATATQDVVVAPVAEPPTASAPATLALSESAIGVAIAGVSVGPLAEDADDTVSATLTVSHGTLHVVSLSGVTVTGDDCATLTLSGSAAAVDTLLAGLTYTPTAEYEGSDTLRLSVTSSDGSNTNPTTASASTAITVNPVAVTPKATTPATLTLNENATGVVIAGLSVGPLAEDNDDTVSATLEVSQGTLHVGSVSGVTVAGDDSATLTLSGNAAAVNSLLAGLTYTPTAEYEGADTLRLSVTSSDDSNTNPTTASASTAITVNPVAGTPTATTPATLTLNENATGVAIAGLSVGPLAEDNDDTVSATLEVSQGTLHVGSVSGVTVAGDDSATLTLSGSAAAVNSLLSGLTYTPTAEYEGADTLRLSVASSDGSNTNPTTASASTAITVKPVAEAPTATAPATVTYGEDEDEDADIVAIAGVSVGPQAEDGDDTVSATLTVSHGTLHVGSLSGVTVTGDDSGTLTLSGSAAAVNKVLAGLTYMPFEPESSDTLRLSVTSIDGSNVYPTPANATTALRLEVHSESLIVGGPGPMLDWNDAANWSDHIVPTLGIDVTINAPSNYTAIITGAPVAQAESLTIPHGAATTEIAVGGTLQLAGDLNVSFSGKLENDGTLKEMANATFIGPVINNGTIIVDPNVNLDVNSTITGIGKFWIDSGTTLEFALGSKVAPGTTDSQTIYFEQGAGKLIIDDWGKFTGVITGTDIGTHLTSADLIDLTQLPFVGGSMSASVSYSSGTNISTVTFSDGNSANNVTLRLSGDYTGSAWSFKSINGGAGTETSDPPTTSATVTSGGATGQIVAASDPTTYFTDASGTNVSPVPGTSQKFTGQIVGITPNGMAGTLSASQTLTSSPIKSAGGYGAFPMTAAAVWAYTSSGNSAANAPNIGDALANIIMGGFGAALLTGGNGNDTVVSSSVSDSNAPQFDTITDFVPGSDKIDLTALGSLSHILTLTPTSTSVPAHTIAYDSKANQTVVYVNPTDQTLSIGNSGLHEIHLPGVAAVQLSDFVLAPTTTAAQTVVAASDPIDLAATAQSDATMIATTTAVDSPDKAVVTPITTDVSSDTIVGNSALFVNSNLTAQTANIGDGLDNPRDNTDSIASAKFASLDEGSVDHAATILPGGLTVQLPQVTATAQMQTGFAPDQKPVSDRADTTTINHGASVHGPTVDGGSGIVPSGDDWGVNPKTSSNGDNGAPIPDKPDGSHAQELDTNPIVVLDSRFLKTLENGSGDRSIAGDAGEHALHGSAVPDVEPIYLTQIMSGENVGTPGDSFHFKDDSSGSKGSGVIGVAELNDVPVSMNHHLEATGTHGPLSISEGGVTPSTLGDSFHFKEISSLKGSGVNNFAEPDQIPTSITHHENAAVPHEPPPISAPQTIEMSLPGPQSADSLDVALHHPQSHFVTHDLIV